MKLIEDLQHIETKLKNQNCFANYPITNKVRELPCSCMAQEIVDEIDSGRHSLFLDYLMLVKLFTNHVEFLFEKDPKKLWFLIKLSIHFGNYNLLEEVFDVNFERSYESNLPPKLLFKLKKEKAK